MFGSFVFAFVVLLGVLIFVHELGHFLVAKAVGVRVLKFSLGFGPPVGLGKFRLRWMRGHTEYVVAWIPLGGFVTVPYASSKGGIMQMTRALATAWAKDNIQVNAILPGWINTDLTANARAEVEGLYERVLERTPAGRWGEPDDHAGIAVFLSSVASDFVTGTAIPVDGGYSIRVG